MANEKPKEFFFNEKTTGQITATIVREDGTTVIGSGELDTATLTLFDRAGTIINGRNDQNILNNNGVTIDTLGSLVWTVASADNAIVESTTKSERHTALFKFTWESGTKVAYHEIILIVRNLSKVS